MRSAINVRVLALLAAAGLSACGGGGDNGISVEQRTQAADATASNNSKCQSITPFYWEIGDATGALASGSAGDHAPTATTELDIASASKLMYSAYVVEKNNGTVDSQNDVPYLNFTSGYSNFKGLPCSDTGTVDDCLRGANGALNKDEAANKQFDYDGGHMQKHASLNGLGDLNRDQLAAEIRSQIGTDVPLEYSFPVLAGSGRSTPQGYAVFLRKLLDGSGTSLQIGSLLGSNAVCTLPSSSCNSAYSPMTEAWHYSLGHWVEDDPNSSPPGDGAFNSVGTFGFYPWVSADRKLYGIVAREKLSLTGEGYSSVQCGRLIRRAWVTGEAQ